MNLIRLKPALAVVALASALLMAEAAQAAPYAPWAYHPAAAAHMNAAIRVMVVAGRKPCHVRMRLGVVANRHLVLAQRYTQRPEAQAQLGAAIATLGQLTRTPGVPPFDAAIQRTQLAMQLECTPVLPAAYSPTYAPVYSPSASPQRYPSAAVARPVLAPANSPVLVPPGYLDTPLRPTPATRSPIAAPSVPRLAPPVVAPQPAPTIPRPSKAGPQEF